MQMLSIKRNTTLSDLIKQVGSRNIDGILALNSLVRTPNIGVLLYNQYESDKVSCSIEVDNQKKQSILNTLTSDSDIFEAAALLNNEEWKILDMTGSLPGMLRIPESIVLPDSINILGNNEPVKRAVYDAVMHMLDNKDSQINPGVFSEYSSTKSHHIINTYSFSNPIQWFNLPWGKITLYSSLSNDSVNFPVFPNEYKDGISANYETMPDLLYQYEPWQVYKGSGPRTNSFTFDMHRDMWSGNHLDGKCNELIRFCEANCYPEFKGASVQTSTVTLYIAGNPLISGVLTNVDVSWDGPLGQDNWYLHCNVELTIIEVSQESLNYTKIRERGLIR